MVATAKRTRKKKHNLPDETINIAINMVGYQDFEDDLLYIQGLEKGKQDGLKEGIERGIERGIEKGLSEGLEMGEQEGKEEKDIIAVRNMLKKGFDPLIIAEIPEVTNEYISSIREQLKKEPVIAGMLQKKNADVQKIAKQQKVRAALVKVIKQHLNQ